MRSFSKILPMSQTTQKYQYLAAARREAGRDLLPKQAAVQQLARGRLLRSKAALLTGRAAVPAAAGGVPMEMPPMTMLEAAKDDAEKSATRMTTTNPLHRLQPQAQRGVHRGVGFPALQLLLSFRVPPFNASRPSPTQLQHLLLFLKCTH